MTRREKKPGELPWLTYDKDRNGNSRMYVRKGGRRIRIRLKSDDPGFPDEYKRAVASIEALTKKTPTVAIRGVAENTLAWLSRKYIASDIYRAYAPSTRKNRERILANINDQVMPDAASGTLGCCPITQFDASHVRYLRDVRKGAGPAGTNNRRKVLSAMFSWAIDEGIVNHNPCRDVKKVKYKKKPIHTWTEDELRRYISRWSLGSREFLAFCLLLLTGMRKSDMVRFGPEWVSNGVITYTPQKTSNTTGKTLFIPMLPHLQAAIVATKVVPGATYLMTNYGEPFTVNGFGNWFRERCDLAGLPHCTAHGLRKAGATIVAENAGSGPQLMAIFGWSNLQQANVYIEKANQKKLAAQAMHLIGIPSIEADTTPLLPLIPEPTDGA